MTGIIGPSILSYDQKSTAFRYYFASSNLCIAGWVFCMYQLYFLETPQLLWIKTSLFLGIFALNSTVFFFWEYPKRVPIARRWYIALGVAAIAIALFIPGNQYLSHVSADRVYDYGPLHPLFAAYCIGLLLLSLGIALARYLASSTWEPRLPRWLSRYRVGRSDLARMNYTYAGYLLLMVSAMTSNLIFPLFGNMSFLRYGPLFSLLFLVPVALGVLRHQLFDLDIMLKKAAGLILGAAASILLFTQLDLLNDSPFFNALVLSMVFFIIGTSSLAAEERVDSPLLFNPLTHEADLVSLFIKQVLEIRSIQALQNWVRCDLSREIQVTDTYIMGLQVDETYAQPWIQSVYPSILEYFRSEQGAKHAYLDRRTKNIIATVDQISDTILLLPLRLGRGLKGVWIIHEKESGDGFSDIDLHTFHVLSSVISILIQDLQHYQTLSQQVQDLKHAETLFQNVKQEWSLSSLLNVTRREILANFPIKELCWYFPDEMDENLYYQRNGEGPQIRLPHGIQQLSTPQWIHQLSFETRELEQAYDSSDILLCPLFHQRRCVAMALLVSKSGEQRLNESTRQVLGASFQLVSSQLSKTIIYEQAEGMVQYRQDIFKNLRVGILHFNLEGSLLFSNPMAAEMLNWEGRDLVVDRVQDLPYPMERGIHSVIESKVAEHIEFPFQANNHTRYYAIQVSPLSDGVMVTMSDMSRIVRVQQEIDARERLSTLGKIAADIAQDITRPISSIKTLSKGLISEWNEDSKDAFSKDLPNHIQYIQSKCQILSDLMTAPALTVNYIDMNQILGAVKDSCDTESAYKNLKIHYEPWEVMTIHVCPETVQWAMLQFLKYLANDALEPLDIHIQALSAKGDEWGFSIEYPKSGVRNSQIGISIFQYHILAQNGEVTRMNAKDTEILSLRFPIPDTHRIQTHRLLKKVPSSIEDDLYG